MESHVYWAPATDRVPSLDQDPLEKAMDTHSSILAWRIPWTEEPMAYHPWGLKESGTTEQQTLSALVVINLCECVFFFFFYLNSFTLMYMHHLILKLVGKRDYNLSILSNFTISYLFFNRFLTCQKLLQSTESFHIWFTNGHHVASAHRYLLGINFPNLLVILVRVRCLIFI